MQKYLASPKGRAARKRAQDKYNRSPRARAVRRRYLLSCKGREAIDRHKWRRERFG